MRILLVEDDTLLAQVLSDHLMAQHYTVDTAIDGATGLEFAQSAAYDLIVLDVNLPKLNGIRLCELLRQNRCTMPILLLTAKGDSSDKVIGLDSGADDYVVKPCSVEEISARIRALLRRLSPDKAPILSWGNLSLNPVTCEVTCNDQPISLSAKEYSLLELLLRNPQRVFSSSNILEHLWSFEDAPSEETIRSHIKRLRRKLKASGSDDLIDTVYGIGYRLKPPPAPLSPFSALNLDSSPNPDSSLNLDSPPNLDSPENQARAAAAALWEQFKQPILERVASLDRAIAALEAGHLPNTLQQEAAQAAHKLAGSLAMFGFAAGTPLGRELEQLLCTPSPTAAAIRPLVEELHQVLASPATLTTALPAPFPGTSGDIHSGNIYAPLKVLAVDDDLLTLNRLEQYSRNWGVSMTTLNDPEQFWQTLEQVQPDLIILDLQMPTINGIELCQVIRSDRGWSHLPILFLTAQQEPDTVLAIYRAGADDYISKPFREIDVMTRIFNRMRRTRLLKSGFSKLFL